MSHHRGAGPGPRAPHAHSLAPEEFIRLKVKAELRKRMRGVRRTTPLEACAARSAKIIERLTAHPAMSSANSVALFWPILARHEVDLRTLDEALRARGARVAYPGIDPDSGEMSFRFVDDPSRLEEAGYGFSEPPADAPSAEELDLVVVPALAVDPTGHRIGYGAGYYDRTLPRYAPPALTIAVAFDWQLIAEVPTTPGDVRVSWIVTDERVLDAAQP